MALEFDFDQINKAIDRVVVSIERLDKTLASSGKQAATFNRLFGSTAQFDKFIKSIKELDAVAATNFKSIADSIASLAKAVSKIPSDSPGLANVVSSVRELNKLAKESGSKANIARFGEYLSKNIGYIEEIHKRVKKMSAGNTAADFQKITDSSRRVLVAIGMMSTAISKMDTSSISTNKLDPVFMFISKVNSLASIKSNGVDSLNSTGRAIRAVAAMMKSISELPVSAIISSKLDAVYSIIPRITALASIPVGKSTTFDVSRGLVSSIARMMKAISELPLSGLIDSKVQSLVTLINNITRLSLVPAGKKSNVYDVTRNLVRVIGLMMTAITGMPDSTVISSKVNALIGIMQKFADLAGIVGAEKLKSISTFFAGFGSAVSSLNRYFKSIAGDNAFVDTKKFDTMRIVFDQIKGLFINIIDVSGRKGQERGMEAAATLIKSIMKIIKTLGETEPSKGILAWGVYIDEYIRILGKFKTVFRAFSDAAEGIRGARNLSQLGNGIRDIVNSMSSVNKMVKEKAGEPDVEETRSFLEKMSRVALFIPIIAGKIVSGLDIGARIKRRAGFGALPAVIREIGFVSTEIGKIAGRIPDNVAVQKVGDAVKNISTAMKTIDDLASTRPKALDIGPRILRNLGIGQLANIMREIGFVARELGKSAGRIKDLDKLRDLGIAMDNFSKFFNSINKMSLADFQKSDKLLGVFGGSNKFTKSIGVIKQFANAFKGFKGVNVPNLEQILPAMLNFSQSLKGVDFSNKNFKGFAAFADELGKGMAKLSQHRIDGNRINSIGAALSNIRNIGGGNRGGGSGSGSIFRDALGDFLGQLGAQAIGTAISRFEGFVRRVLTFDTALRQSLNSIGNSIRNFGRNAEMIGRSLVNNFGIQNLISNQGVEIASNFGHLINQIQVFGGLTEEETKRAEKFADVIGIKYPLSSNDAAQAILDLIKAGQDLNSVEFVLPNAADLAALGDIDIKRATGAIITATNVFQDLNDEFQATFENSNITASMFSAAADVSVAELEDIIQAFENVGPAAQAAGLDVEQTLATIATLADRGLRGAEGGTGLRSALNALFNRPQAKDELGYLQDRVLAETGEQINLALADSNGQLREFDDILDSINAAYTSLNLTEAERLESLGKLADTYGRNTLAILLNTGGYDQQLERMREVESAEVRAQRLMDDFKGDVDQLSGSIETLNKNGFRPMIENGFRPMVRLGKLVVNTLIDMPERFFEIVGDAALLGSTLATLTGGFILATAAVIKFQGVMTLMAGGIISIFTRIPYTIALITGFVGSLVTLTAVIGTLMIGIGGAAIIFNEFRRSIRENIGGAGDSFNRFKREAQRAIDAVLPALREFGGVMNSLFGRMFRSEADAFGGRVAGLFDALAGKAVQVRRGIQQFAAFFEVFSNFTKAQEGGETAGEIAEINSQLTRLSRLSIIKKIFGDDINAAGLRNIFRTMQRGFQDIGRGVDLLLSGGIGVLFGESGSIQKVKFGAGMLLKTFAKAISRITGIDLSKSIFNFEGGNIREGMISFFQQVLNTVKELIGENRDEFVNILTQLITLATPVKLFNLAGFILRIFGFDQAAGVVEGIGLKIQELISGAINFAIDLMTGKIEFFNELGELLRDQNFDGAVSYLADGIHDLLVDLLGRIPGIIRDLGTTLNLPFLTQFGIDLETSDAFKGIINALASLVSKPISKISRILEGVEGFVEAVSVGNPGAIAILATGLGLLASRLNLISKIKSFLIFNLVINSLTHLKNLLEGDVVGFIKGTLLGLGADLYSMITGEDIDENALANKFEAGLQAVIDNGLPLINALGTQISNAISKIGAQIINAANDVRARIDQSLGVASTGFGDAFFAAQSAIRSRNPEDIFRTLADPRIDRTARENLVNENRDTILHAFAEAVGSFDSPGDIPSGLFSNIVDSMGLEMIREFTEASGIDSGWVARFAARALTGENLSVEEATQIVQDSDAMNNLVQGFIDAWSKGINDDANTLLARIAIDPTGPANGRPLINTDMSNLTPTATDVEGLRQYFLNWLEQAGLGDLPSESIAQIARNIADQYADNMILRGTFVANSTWNTIADSFEQEAQANPINLNPDVTVDAASVDASPLENSINREVSRVAARINVSVLGRANQFLNPRVNTSGQQAFRNVTSQYGPFPMRGNGGNLSPYNVYGVHDTPRPELAMFADGTSLLFTGAAKGRMVKIMGMAAAPTTSGFMSREEWKKQNRSSSLSQQDDNADEIADLTKDIEEAFIEFTEKRNEAIRKSNQDALDAEREYQHDRQNILDEGRETLLEAVRKGDGAAALQAVKNARKQLKELEYNNNVQNEERARSLQETIDSLNKEREEKIKGYVEQINDLKTQNEELIAEDDAYYDEEFLMLQQHNGASEAEMARFNREMENQQRRSSTDRLREAERGDRETNTVIGNMVSNVRYQIETIFNTLIAKAAQASSSISAMNYTPAPPVSQTPYGPNTSTNPNQSGVGTPLGGTGSAPPFPGSSFGQTINYGGQLWVWVGTRWQIAYTRASGGSVTPRGAYRVFDTNKPELFSMSDGTGILLSGNKQGYVTPLNQSHNGYGTTRGGDVNISVNLGDIVSNASDPSRVADEVLSTVIPEIERIAYRANRNNRNKGIMDIS